MIDTNGIITFRDIRGRLADKEIFKVELRSDGQPLISVEIRDRNNVLLGKVWKSTSFVHCHPDYEGEEYREGTQVKRINLRRKKDSAVIFDLEIRSPNEVEINGIFHIEGFPHPIEATRNYTRIGGTTLAYNTKIGGRRGIILTQNSIGF